MPFTPTTLTILREQIKLEGKIRGSDDLNLFVDNLINEVLRQFTEKERYQEMFVVDYVLTMVDNSGNVTLPANFQHFEELRYSSAPTALDGFRVIGRRTGYHVRSSAYGYPRYYELAGGVLKLFPYDSIRAAQTLKLDYYKAPDDLVADASVFPIEKLVIPVKRACISRVALYYDQMARSAAFNQGSELALNQVQVSNTTTNE